MNVFIDVITGTSPGAEEKRLPLIYFWLKDYCYQRAPENFSQCNWSFNDDPIPIRDNKQAQEKLFANPPDIMGISLYMWSEKILLDDAQWVKEHFPNCLIIAGGPHADSREKFLSNNTYIDAVVIGPGAESFRRIIDCKMQNKVIDEVEGLCYWTGQEVIRNKPVERKEDPLVLDYVTNFNDEIKTLLDEYTKKYSKVIWTTMYIQGCPYSCSFCEQGTSLWTKIHKRELKTFLKEVDLIGQYKDMIIEFADANFGIVPEYEDILDYIIATAKKNGSLQFVKPSLAKNQTDFTTYLMQKMIDSGVAYDDHSIGKMTLQDPNPEVVKFNGRPFAKEYEKIKLFQDFTKDQDHKTAKIEIILGMPGQTFETLSGSLHEMQKRNLLTHALPYWYLVFPNTVLTSPGATYQFKTNEVNVRSAEHFQKAFLDHPNSDTGFTFNYMIETEHITTAELSASWYHWTLMCHLYGFLGWMRTPINYLQNYHDIDSGDFIKEYTRQFHPDNWDELPESFRLDLVAFERWLKGEDRLFQRHDNTGKYWVAPRRSAQHRFHANPDDFMSILHKIFSNLIDIDNDPNIKPLFAWQKSKIMRFEDGNRKQVHKTISYNWDDIAVCKDKSYFKSIWEFSWPEVNLYEQTLTPTMMQFVPTVSWQEITDISLQKELTFLPYEMIA